MVDAVVKVKVLSRAVRLARIVRLDALRARLVRRPLFGAVRLAMRLQISLGVHWIFTRPAREHESHE